MPIKIEVTPTPGPWRVAAHVGDYNPRRKTFILAGDESTPTIVAEYEHHRPGSADHRPPAGEANANLDLAAAAPELLEALEQCLELLLTDDYRKDSPTVSQARAAIRKAKGE